MGYVALDLGATKLALRLGEAGAARDMCAPLPDLHDGRVELAHVVAVLTRLLAEAPAPVAAIGVAAAPAVGPDGIVTSWPNRPHWIGLPLGEALRALAPTVVIEDDGAAGAIAEASGRRESRIASLSIGTGVGGGLVADGVLQSEFREPGHLVVDPDGPPCACGLRGCVQVFASGRAILRRAGVGVSGWQLERALRLGDVRAELALAPGVTALAACLKLLRPDVAFIGGGFAAAVPTLISRLDAAVELPVAPSAFGAKTALEGAARLAREAIRDGGV
jgi:kanosamine 6-kinase